MSPPTVRFARWTSLSLLSALFLMGLLSGAPGAQAHKLPSSAQSVQAQSAPPLSTYTVNPALSLSSTAGTVGSIFCPAECGPGACNYQDARPYAGGMQLVPVSTLDQALDFLRHEKHLIEK